jgi:hypothetical protein
LHNQIAWVINPLPASIRKLIQNNRIMKKFVYLSLIGLAFIAAVTPPTPKKVALIIAIGQYPDGGQWRNLSSMNDLRYVKTALVKSGFTATDIDTLVNKDATKKGMVKALDDLYNKVSEGDIVYFQFSGHGQQIEDDNNDELDGYDEALVPYDADGRYDPVTYKGQNHFRDDLLGEKLNKIRKKIGPKGSLVVLVDACHSGTQTRGPGIKRGTEVPFKSPNYKLNIKIDPNKNPETGMLEGFTDGMGSMVVFSACSPNQPNFEVKDDKQQGVGSLSYAFAKSIADLPAESNYAVLFHKMKAFVQGEIATQIPMVEGNLELEVFGGKYIAKPTIIAVEQRFNNASNKFNDTTFIINQGQLNSINKGTTLKIYPTGSNELYAEGVVTQVSTFQSICTSNKPLKKNVGYEVKINGMSAGEFSASLMIQNNDGKSKLANMIVEQFKDDMRPHQFLSISDNPDYTLDITKDASGGYKVSLLEKGDSVRYVKTITDSLTQDDFKYFLNGIKRSMRVKYLRNMSDGGSFAKYVKVEIVPAVKQTNQNELVMRPDDAFKIVITNTGTEDYYYTILDIMPDDDVKVLLPDDSSEAADFVIHPGQSIPIGEITVDKGTPNGKEMFKLIVTKNPIDLRSVLNRSKPRSVNSMRSVETVVDDLFKDSNDGRSTRSSMNTIKVDEVGMVTCGFTVKN